MILADAGRTIALASIPLPLALDRLSFAQLVAVATIEGTLFTFFNVAESASLPQVVTPEQLPDAVGMNSAVDSVSILIGPAISGSLYAITRALPFVLDAVSYLATVVSLLFISAQFQQEREKQPNSLRAEIGEGLRWLRRQPLLRFLAVLVGGLNLFSFGYPLLLIVRAQQLHAGPFATGLLFATGGMGSILGSLAVGPLQRRCTIGQLMIGGSWVWALSWLPFALAPNLPILGAANALGWLIIPLFMGTQYSYRLRIIPDRLQGRANSIFKLTAFGVEPISYGIIGVLIQLFGPVETVFLIMAPQIALAILATANSALRRAPRLQEIAY